MYLEELHEAGKGGREWWKAATGPGREGFETLGENALSLFSMTCKSQQWKK